MTLFETQRMRSVCLGWLVLAPLVGCRPPEPPPLQAPASPPPSQEPAPLPPEETPSPEPEAPRAREEKPPEPGITATGAPTRGKLPKAIIDAKLSEAQPGILSCYERALKTKPDLHGMVTIDFVVSPEGKVVHAEAASEDEPGLDDATTSCILAELRKLEFPPPQGGRVFIHYPLKLEPPKP
jgi:hypothetical protein